MAAAAVAAAAHAPRRSESGRRRASSRHRRPKSVRPPRSPPNRRVRRNRSPGGGGCGAGRSSRRPFPCRMQRPAPLPRPARNRPRRRARCFPPSSSGRRAGHKQGTKRARNQNPATRWIEKGPAPVAPRRQWEQPPSAGEARYPGPARSTRVPVARRCASTRRGCGGKPRPAALPRHRTHRRADGAGERPGDRGRGLPSSCGYRAGAGANTLSTTAEGHDPHGGLAAEARLASLQPASFERKEQEKAAILLDGLHGEFR